MMLTNPDLTFDTDYTSNTFKKPGPYTPNIPDKTLFC